MTPGVFIEHFAQILGLPSKSIVVIDRALLEAGLRSRGGRGRSAAKVKVADAATLLLAVMATPALTQSDQAVLRWLRVKSFGRPKSMPEPFGSMFAAAAPLPLLTLLEKLIAIPPADYGDHSIVLEVCADQMIAILYVRKGGKRGFEISFAEYPDQEVGSGKARPAPSGRGDLTRNSKVTDETFRSLHRLFHAVPLAHSAPADQGGEV
jgi:hypothetical protein